ncbi:N-acetylglucosamine-6-sulfatase-like isoform X1 [Spodoptera litura]|uniref:N-acetylglucosamine-6-sulfatase-like isoform X1 n=1 Tax=Spodoptera litura TaxID=69820 RepID=A0A9J7IX16_SPOLT|nr:N-acetylglucosamine-6-sulfatase-like isoform X1 [Spodoptera litura]
MLNYLLFFSLLGVSVCQKRPNIVLVLTDDQDVVLGGMTPMKSVQRFIADEGVTFTNSYVTSPICCPSRASLLSGLYQHNHRTVTNSELGGCNGIFWREAVQNVTFGNFLKEAGYKTFYAGKYLNQYGTPETGGPEAVPPGWTEWHGLVGNSVYYNYTISNNGVPTVSTDQYLTDVIRELGVSYIENQTDQDPFLMVLAPPDPHQPFTPAPRHEGKFSNVTAVRHPNFNIPAEDKHWLMRMPPSPLPESMLPELDRVYRSRWESLLAVDEMVADVVGALEKQALLDNTYIIYTSDNGYHVGQFSQVYDKRQPYESDTKVPLLIRGPGITPNSSNSIPVLNVDLAPTILHLAEIQPPEHMDGKPINLFGHSEGQVERYMLVEYHGEGRDGSVSESCPWKYDGNRLAKSVGSGRVPGFVIDLYFYGIPINEEVDDLMECYPEYACKCQDARNNTYACVRHFANRINMKYCEFADQEEFVEIYDLNRDPYEVHNSVDEVFPSVRHWYRLVLARLQACAGAASCDNPLNVI